MKPALALGVCILILCVGAITSAATDAATVAVAFDWKLYLGIFLAALAGVRTLLEGIAAILRIFAKRTKTTLDDRALALDEAALAKLDEFIGVAKSLQPPQPPKPPLAPVAMLALVVLGLAGASQVSCDSWRPRTAAGVTAFLDCESPNVDAGLLAEAKSLSTAAVGKWISGSGRVDTAGIRAEMAPLKSDLFRCGFVAAIAAAATPTTPQPGAPASSELVVDGAALRGAYSRARADLGWPAVMVGGQVL